MFVYLNSDICTNCVRLPIGKLIVTPSSHFIKNVVYRRLPFASIIAGVIMHCKGLITYGLGFIIPLLVPQITAQSSDAVTEFIRCSRLDIIIVQVRLGLLSGVRTVRTSSIDQIGLERLRFGQSFTRHTSIT